MHCIDGGDLGELSTSAVAWCASTARPVTLALENEWPVVVLGDAVYDVPCITHQAGLDSFWSNPERNEAELYAAFKKVLHAKCLVRGGWPALATETLVQAASSGCRPKAHADRHP